MRSVFCRVTLKSRIVLTAGSQLAWRSTFIFLFLSSLSFRPIRAMPMVMTNSLGQVTLNNSILTTATAGVPVTVANAGTTPKLVIQALPTMLPAGSKAGEKITIITIPANQLATFMQANSSGQVTQLIQAKPGVTQVAQANIKAPTAPVVQLAAGRPQLILAKAAAVAQPLPQLSVQVSQPPPKSPTQPPNPSSSQPDASQSDAAAEAPPASFPPAASAQTSAS